MSKKGNTKTPSLVGRRHQWVLIPNAVRVSDEEMNDQGHSLDEGVKVLGGRGYHGLAESWPSPRPKPPEEGVSRVGHCGHGSLTKDSTAVWHLRSQVPAC